MIDRFYGLDDDGDCAIAHQAGAFGFVPVHAAQGRFGANDDGPPGRLRGEGPVYHLKSSKKSKATGVNIDGWYSGGFRAQRFLYQRSITRDGLLNGEARVDDQINIGKCPTCIRECAGDDFAGHGRAVFRFGGLVASQDSRLFCRPPRFQIETLVEVARRDAMAREVPV